MIAVVGAGITGLALAERLRREGRDVVLLEAGDRAGGAIRTEHVNGCVVEHGPQALRGTSAALEALVDRLGLKRTLASEHARSRYLVHRGKLCAATPSGLLRGRILGPSAMARALFEPFVSSTAEAHESVAHFVARRFGPAVADALLDPVIGGITAGDPSQIDVHATFPEWVRRERGFGGVLGGALTAPRRPGPAMYTFEGGIQVLVDALADSLGDALRLGVRVEGYDPGVLHTTTGDIACEAAVWCCRPSWMEGPPSAPICAVALVWDRLDTPFHGFGWLVGSKERRDVLGCLFVSDVFPGHAGGGVLYRVLCGGVRDPDAARCTDEQLVHRARCALAEVQGIDTAPRWTRVIRHPGIPQYDVGHRERVDRVSHLFGPLVGWWWTGVGVAQCVDAAYGVASPPSTPSVVASS